ncbi:U3 small nucleolar RNA-associated protein 14 homolog A [Eurosta solidaginis]|uniref:U3 small nucleolar RNA-associated protein 14 homolog A n=1 Tax=Eurosta solidaginis TaxID=178769 RepID=UPI003530C7A3
MIDEEEQFNPTAHKKLLQGISSLGKTQHIRKTTRNEPLRQQDEFQLVKPTDETVVRHPVALKDIVGVLKTTKRHIDTGRKLKNLQRSKNVLDKPLEKPQADRMKRGLGYEKTKKSLERWDAVVAQNRNAEQQVFPLPSETIYINTTMHRRPPLQRSIKSELALELEAENERLRQAKRALGGETENEADLAKREEELLKKKLTRDELIARRKELKYLRIRESQKSLKARKQNKIKSKKYHKLLKKQKMQDQIKQFEILQKTNPEAALEKLNELEKSRVRERASLRHKNTGTWAKNLQIRAKYDKDVRKDLAEQLQISRQLTQKKTNSDDDENEDGDDVNTKMEVEKVQEADADPFNPWTRVGNAAKSAKQAEENKKENWRKYWLERNENEKMLDEYKKLLEVGGSGSDEDMEDKTKVGVAQVGCVKSENGEDIESTKNVHLKTKSSSTKNAALNSNIGKIKKAKQKLKKVDKKAAKASAENMQNKVAATKSKNGANIDEMFDEHEDKIKSKLNNKLKNILQKSKQIQSSQFKGKKHLKSRIEKDALKNLKDLSFKKQAKNPEIDEELLNSESVETEKQIETDLNNSNNNEAVQNATKEQRVTKLNAAENSQPTIDPNKLADVKLKQHVNNFSGLNETIDDDNADIDMSDDEAEERAHLDQQMTINEAFEDDDIVADFTRDKTKDAEIKNAEIDLFMPGWGSWAGAGLSAEKQNAKYKNKRLILKLADKEKRRDDNKGELYINEAPSKQLRTHLVSSVPFPFTSVAEYESSISATIGRNCVPETAFRMLTRPAVIVRKGQIIEPMGEMELSKPKRKLKNVVDKRIAHLNKANVNKTVKVK